MVAMRLSNFHQKQQLKTDLKILDWMGDFSIIEPELVWISIDDEKKEVEKRVYWINGISKGTGLYKETVRKSIERLIEHELIWEWPKTRQTRFFQLYFPWWKQHYKWFMKQQGNSVPIPRVKGSIKARKNLVLGPKKKRVKLKKSMTLKELARKWGMSKFYDAISD